MYGNLCGVRSPRPIEHLSIEWSKRHVAELGGQSDESADGRAIRGHSLASGQIRGSDN